MPRTPKKQVDAPQEAPIQLDITIDISALRLPDLRLISRIFRGAAGDEDTIDLLERVVVGGADKLAQIPVDQLRDVLRALHAAVYSASNPETPEGN